MQLNLVLVICIHSRKVIILNLEGIKELLNFGKPKQIM